MKYILMRLLVLQVQDKVCLATSHFSWRNNNLSVYKAFEHQHLNEIGESLRKLIAAF